MHALSGLDRAHQREVESWVKRRRRLLEENNEPLDVALLRLRAVMVGLWVYGVHGGHGEFVILAAAPERLVLVDRASGEFGDLVGPDDPAWRPPPYGFPALLCAQLRPGSGLVWLRLNRPGEVSLLHKPDDEVATKWKRTVAFRMPGEGEESEMSFLAVHAMHSLVDGQSYEPIVGDLLALYDASVKLPAAGSGLAALQRRLHHSLDIVSPAAIPQMSSLRGTLFSSQGKGYGHLLGIRRGAVQALKLTGRGFGVPFDVMLLGLTAVAIARVNAEDAVHFTLYAPMRDEAGEAEMIGLFADWRHISVRADLDTATVLGVVLDLEQAIRLRRWSVFNAFCKPEVRMVNFQPLDTTRLGSRAGFVQVGEELWRIGENLKQETRSNDLNWVPQRFSLTIEKQDSDTWWLLLSVTSQDHPPAWMRRFVHAFTDAFWAILRHPQQRVHRAFPTDVY